MQQARYGHGVVEAVVPDVAGAKIRIVSTEQLSEAMGGPVDDKKNEIRENEPEDGSGFPENVVGAFDVDQAGQVLRSFIHRGFAVVERGKLQPWGRAQVHGPRRPERHEPA